MESEVAKWWALGIGFVALMFFVCAAITLWDINNISKKAKHHHDD